MELANAKAFDPAKVKGLMLLFRHGERLDGMNVDPEEKNETKVINPLDIPLSKVGKEQAFFTGQFLNQWLADKGIPKSKATFKIISSPYMRCL